AALLHPLAPVAAGRAARHRQRGGALPRRLPGHPGRRGHPHRGPAPGLRTVAGRLARKGPAGGACRPAGRAALPRGVPRHHRAGARAQAQAGGGRPRALPPRRCAQPALAGGPDRPPAGGGPLARGGPGGAARRAGRTAPRAGGPGPGHAGPRRRRQGGAVDRARRPGAAFHPGHVRGAGVAELARLPDRLGRGASPGPARLGGLRDRPAFPRRGGGGPCTAARWPGYAPRMTGPSRIAFLASPAADAQAALSGFVERHGQCPPAEADIICALGGDGFMLQTLHRHGGVGKPVYGFRLGTVGFLMSHHAPEGGRMRVLMARREAAGPAVLRPLEMVAAAESGASVGSLAYNEVWLLRQTRQAAHVSIELNGQVRLDELVCDGVMLATPAGSTAYNYSAHGPILP